MSSAEFRSLFRQQCFRQRCVALTAAAVMLVLSGCGGPAADPAAQPTPVTNAVDVPAEYAAGQQAFRTYCMECHGEAGSGTDQGPPLVHVIYEPGHHGDQSFFTAARMGVQAHHWPYGNMVPVAGVTDEEIAEIVGYVRFLQREAGIE